MLVLHDNRIIQQHQHLQVHAQRLEVMFRDGSAVNTHLVASGGPQPEPLLRALELEGLRWLVVDLATLCPGLREDAARMPARDATGLCFFHLRQHFGSARAFVEASRVAALASWWRKDMATAGVAA